MKKAILTTIILLFFANTFAQVKVFSGGNVSIGTTTAPLSGIRMNIHGNVSLADSDTLTSAAYIRSAHNYSTNINPDYTWLGNDHCGIFHPASDNIGICMNTLEKFRFTSSGILNYGDASFFSSTSSATSAPYIHGNNSFSAELLPDYSWYNNENTGIFHPDTNFIGITNDGKETARFTPDHNMLIGGTFNGGNCRLVVNAKDDVHALATFTDFTTDYAYAHVSYVNRKYTKNWVVVHDTIENFYVYGNGDVWSRTNYYTSDSILKENVQPLLDARSKILSLRGVSYNFKPEHLNNPQDTFTVLSNDPPRTQIGFIAEEVERVVPEVVGTNDRGIKGVAYQNLISLLVEAFKQQNATLDSLKNQLALCCPASSPRLGGRQSNPIGNNDGSGTNSVPRLDQNNPNPFNTTTEIHFFIPENASSKTLLVFDMQGTLIKQYSLSAKGESQITISASELKAGMYMYSLIIDGKEIDTKRMILTN